MSTKIAGRLEKSTLLGTAGATPADGGGLERPASVVRKWSPGDEAVLLKKADVARMLSVSTRTVHNLVLRDDLVQVRLGARGSTRITRLSVERMLARGYGKFGEFHGPED